MPLSLSVPRLRAVKAKGRRSMRVLHEARCFGLWTVLVTEGKAETEYDIVRLDADPGAYVLKKREAGKVMACYLCRPAAQECECDGRAHGWSCKHLNMLAALSEKGAL